MKTIFLARANQYVTTIHKTIFMARPEKNKSNIQLLDNDTLIQHNISNMISIGCLR